MLRSDHTKGQFSFVLADSGHIAGIISPLEVSMATGKTQAFKSPGRMVPNRPGSDLLVAGMGRNGYCGMLAVRSKHASPVTIAADRRMHQAPMFVPVSIPLRKNQEIPIAPH